MAMNIQITSRHSKASQTLQDTITADLLKLEKFSDKLTSCHVILDTEHLDKTVEIVVTAFGQTVKADSRADNIGKSFDQALAKVKTQLKKLNEKIKNHKSKTEQIPAVVSTGAEEDEEF